MHSFLTLINIHCAVLEQSTYSLGAAQLFRIGDVCAVLLSEYDCVQMYMC